MIERKAESIRRDIEKIQKSLDTHRTRLEKKTAKAAELDALERKAEWDSEESGFRTGDNLKKFSAWFDMYSEAREVEDIEKRLANANERLNKVIPQVEAVAADKIEEDRVNEMESKFYWINHKSKEEREAEYQEWLREFKAECLKDGVVIEECDGWWIAGTTAKGKRFALYGNSGYTERSRHCYTLYIDKKMVFTSGDFSTAYSIIKRG